MKIERFYELIDRYQAGIATPEEQEKVETYYYYLTQGKTEMDVQDEERMHTVVLEKIMKQIGAASSPAPVIKRNWWRYAAAAVFLGAIATTYLLINKKEVAQPIALITDVAPGKPGAILKLANGTVINLDTARNGELFKGMNKADHALTVDATNENIQYALLETPRGRTIDLVLPDGTKVWLNAGSSIRFPTAFKGKERKVEMTGEAYFEVVHNAKMPFFVKLPDGKMVEDIGTSFNINAYTDEGPHRTTLLEGSVKVNNQLLVPGQQYNNGNITSVNTEEVIAWKNGLFEFHHADIRTIIKQVSRWYDLDVVYEGNAGNKSYSGKISRSLSLKELLDGLEFSEINYRIEQGKKIVIKE